MGAVRLRRLVLHNFRSFLGRHELVFPERGLVILRGYNLDTRGDSGAGKTNVLLALAYALGFCRHSAKALQCWYDEKPMYVEVHMDSDDGQVVLHRGDKLWLQTPARTFRGSAKAVEAELDRICGVEADLREALTYRDQVKPKRFLGMKDTALKEFLFQVLRLQGMEQELEARARAIGVFRGKAESLAAVLKEQEARESEERARLVPFQPRDTTSLQTRVEVLRDRERVLEAEVDRLDRERRDAEESETSAADRAAEQLRSQSSELARELAALKNRLPQPALDNPELTDLRAKLSTCDGHIKRAEEADALAHAAYVAETERLRLEARKLHNELARLPDLRFLVDEKLAQLAKLQEGRCDRCGRPWEETEREVAQVVAEIKSRQAAIEDIRAHQSRARELDEQLSARRYDPDPVLDRLREVRSSIQSAIQAVQQEVSTAALRAQAEHSRLVADLEGRLRLLGVEIARAHDAVLSDPSRKSLALAQSWRAASTLYNQTRLDLVEANAELVSAISEDRQLQAVADEQERRINEAAARAERARQAWQQADEEFRREADYVDLLKGFRNHIFDEVLDDIGSEASAVVGSLPNASHISVRFVSERETESQTIRQEIRPVTYLHGEERSLEEAVSGGQLTSIGLAIDLAVVRIVSSRLGCNLNWVVLDEAFNGHDTVTKQACLEVLQNYAADKLVIIVDHASEVKELFSSSIEVVYENKLSRLA